MEEKTKEKKVEVKENKKSKENKGSKEVNSNARLMKMILVMSSCIIIIITGILVSLNAKHNNKKNEIFQKNDIKSKHTLDINDYAINPDNVNKMQKELNKKNKK